MSTAATKLTYDDYAALPEDGKRYELIEGELYVNASPAPKHQIVSMNLENILVTWVRQHRLGIVLHAPTDVVLSAENVVQPDVFFISTGRRELIGPKNIEGAPDLVVEILSGSNRRNDEIVKRRLYEQHGVSEYWIADPEVDSVLVYRRIGETFERAVTFSASAGDVLESPLFPGLVIKLADVFSTDW